MGDAMEDVEVSKSSKISKRDFIRISYIAKLEDGTVLKVKQVVIQAARSIDKPIPGSNGELLYHVKTQTLVTSVVPKELLFRDGEQEK